VHSSRSGCHRHLDSVTAVIAPESAIIETSAVIVVFGIVLPPAPAVPSYLPCAPTFPCNLLCVVSSDAEAFRGITINAAERLRRVK